MSVIGRIFGYGSSTHQNVLHVSFSQPLSSKIKFECVDNNQTFPQVDTVDSTANEIFGSGDLSSSDSMIALHDLSSGACGGTDWFPSTTNANTASLNLMKGTDSYVTQQSAILSGAGGGSVHFNMQVKVVASYQTSYNSGFDLLARYTYTATTPTVQWWFNNDDSGSGTAASPEWTEIVAGTNGIRHCRSGTATTDSSFLANIPVTGQEKTQVGIVTT